MEHVTETIEKNWSVNGCKKPFPCDYCPLNVCQNYF